MTTEREKIVAATIAKHGPVVDQLVTLRKAMDARKAYNNVDANNIDAAFQSARDDYNRTLGAFDNDTIAALKLTVIDHLAPRVTASIDATTAAKLHVKDTKRRAPIVRDNRDNLADMRRGTGEQLKVASSGDVGNLHLYSWNLSRERFVQWKCVSARVYQADNPGSYKAVYETGKDSTRERMIVTTANVKTLFTADLNYQKVTR